VADHRQRYITLQKAVVEVAEEIKGTEVAVDTADVADHLTSMAAAVTLVHQKCLRAKTGSLANLIIIYWHIKQLKVHNIEVTNPRQ
jgi:hypothetical protein